MSKKRLWILEAIERNDSVMEIIVELRGADIDDETRKLWLSHSLVDKVDLGPSQPRLARLTVPAGARTDRGMDSLVQVLEDMIPRK